MSDPKQLRVTAEPRASRVPTLREKLTNEIEEKILEKYSGILA